MRLGNNTRGFIWSIVLKVISSHPYTQVFQLQNEKVRRKVEQFKIELISCRKRTRTRSRTIETPDPELETWSFHFLRPKFIPLAFI